MPKNHEQVSAALDLLTRGMAPYVEKRLKATYKDNWINTAAASFRDGRDRSGQGGTEFEWDAHSLLTIMWDQWNAVFRNHLGHAERSLVSELREYRNRWAHQQDFDFDDAYRILDSVRRLLEAASADNLEAISRRKQEFLEQHVAEEVNAEIQKSAFDRAKMWVVAIYGICCVAVVYHMMATSQPSTATLVAFVILVFVYLIYQQFTMDPPLLFGPHECGKCKKIIYRRNCPYCEPSVIASNASPAG
jgi:hypothetical protein